MRMAKKTETKTQKKGFFSNWIVRNLLGALVVVVVLIVGNELIYYSSAESNCGRKY